jgi:hypothetical protein
MKLEVRHKTVKRRVIWYDIRYLESVAKYQELYGDDYIYRVHGVKSEANCLVADADVSDLMPKVSYKNKQRYGLSSKS